VLAAASTAWRAAARDLVAVLARARGTLLAVVGAPAALIFALVLRMEEGALVAALAALLWLVPFALAFAVTAGFMAVARSRAHSPA
jgi:hypothetical protein